MKQLLGRTLVAVMMMLSATLAWGHDPRLHGANALTGQVVNGGAHGGCSDQMTTLWQALWHGNGLALCAKSGK